MLYGLHTSCWKGNIILVPQRLPLLYLLMTTVCLPQRREFSYKDHSLTPLRLALFITVFILDAFSMPLVSRLLERRIIRNKGTPLVTKRPEKNMEPGTEQRLFFIREDEVSLLEVRYWPPLPLKVAEVIKPVVPTLVCTLPLSTTIMPSPLTSTIYSSWALTSVQGLRNPSVNLRWRTETSIW